MTTIFFATDVHGSEICWKKFINAGKFYNADILVLGGDMTGKALVPFIKDSKGMYKVNFLEEEMLLDEEGKARMFKNISDRGYYPLDLTDDEFEELSADSEKVEKLFVNHVLAMAERWVAFADGKLVGTGIKCFVCPGNDDMFEIDDVLESSKSITMAEGKLLDLDGHYEMISTGWSNPTPWDTHRECSEEELAEKIEAMASKVPDINRCVFNLHAPPFGSGLDEAPELDENLRPKYAGRSLIPVGSYAVRDAINKYQPPLALTGHIHEGRGIKRMKKTFVVNPGSSYEQSTLLGSIIEMDKKGVKKYVLTSG
ncbi:MAG: metallophosphoesterase [Bacillota bacterium]|nr:metallophosphoesterase [Bacillota bacterium]